MNLKAFLGMGLDVGSLAPDFSLMGSNGKPYTLGEFRGKKVLLYFYPKAFTSVCTEQACSFRDEYSALKNRGYILLGVSTDPLAAVQSFAQSYKLPFILLSDAHRKTCKAYQVLMPIIRWANRITFLIDERGIIEKKFSQIEAKTYANKIIEQTAHGPA
jgi:peroxiredoxin Q/BCP